MHRSSATALTLAVLAVLATGCSDDGSDTDAVPGTPTSAAGAPTGEATPDPVTSTATATTTPTAGTAANTAQVCRAVDQLIIDGSRQIAADSADATREELTPEQLNGKLKGRLSRLADDVREQARKAKDARIKKLVNETATKIENGAAAKSPASWMGSEFVEIPPRLTRDCHV
ncbi:hypothetical protein GA0070216_105316 [Micromonospora matsumotoense]|uniref:Uncharacterized protein n=1 Tax=Micromonospora matsumotoense TaxID=121616 RepID=A0A1C4Y1L3_9ACTN|nr:hypothetical protein [Micromonospora matsumotoense]SCF14609.1 hypothetical protein GA0070216_105316 [Micromonospora matsumotoense]